MLILYLLQIIRESKMGTICNDFVNLENMEIIGSGAFGVVYFHSMTSGEKVAVKKENKVLSFLCKNYYICFKLCIHIFY